MTPEHVETLIIGAGQAGLATSYWLAQRVAEHLILEKASRPGSAWQQRWDSFTLVTPNWTVCLPGAEYQGEARDGFMPRTDIIAMFDAYAADFALPVRYGVEVTQVEALDDGPGYIVRSSAGDFSARNVVVATGLYQRPKIPGFAANLPGKILQLHSGAYRNPGSLPPGAVLVVGSGQSGCQIAEELYLSGRQVFLSIGSGGRAPRRYRGRDIYEWVVAAGFFDRTVDQLPSPKARFAANPHVSGAGGGHDLNLHRFARDGVTLLGHLRDIHDGSLFPATDHRQSLAACDQFEANILNLVDGYIAARGLDAPGERPPSLRDGYDAPEIDALGLERAGITSVIWAGGYLYDFSLIRLPVTDADGFPITQRGVAAYPGLYFVGLPWLHTQKSGFLLGAGADAGYVVERIVGRET